MKQYIFKILRLTFLYIIVVCLMAILLGIVGVNLSSDRENIIFLLTFFATTATYWGIVIDRFKDK